MEIKVDQYSDPNKKFIVYNSKLSDIGYIKVSENPTGFLAEDFKRSHPKLNIVEITDIHVNPIFRYKGIGTTLIKCVIDNYKAGYGTSFISNTVIITTVGASCREYEEEPSSDENRNIILNLIPFYEKNGFIDINDYYAGYENKRAFIYNSPLASECISERKSFVDQFNAEMKSRHDD